MERTSDRRIAWLFIGLGLNLFLSVGLVRNGVRVERERLEATVGCRSETAETLRMELATHRHLEHVEGRLRKLETIRVPHDELGKPAIFSGDEGVWINIRADTSALTSGGSSASPITIQPARLSVTDPDPEECKP